MVSGELGACGSHDNPETTAGAATGKLIEHVREIADGGQEGARVG